MNIKSKMYSFLQSMHDNVQPTERKELTESLIKAKLSNDFYVAMSKFTENAKFKLDHYKLENMKKDFKILFEDMYKRFTLDELLPKLEEAFGKLEQNQFSDEDMKNYKFEPKAEGGILKYSNDKVVAFVGEDRVNSWYYIFFDVDGTSYALTGDSEEMLERDIEEYKKLGDADTQDEFGKENEEEQEQDSNTEEELPPEPATTEEPNPNEEPFKGESKKYKKEDAKSDAEIRQYLNKKYGVYYDGGNDLNLSKKNVSEMDYIPSSVKNLNLGNNNISAIKNVPYDVQSLNLSYNKITKIENIPQGIKKLYLHNNQISKIENIPDSLQELYLQNNPIKQIDKKSYDIMKKNNIKDSGIDIEKLEKTGSSYETEMTTPASIGAFTHADMGTVNPIIPKYRLKKQISKKKKGA